MRKLLIICGPTATGKTDLAVSLAQKWDGELVSADSRQVYRGMDIGTGKDLPSKEKIDRLRLKAYFKDKTYTLTPYRFHKVPLWMVDVVDPDEDFSVAHYYHLATQVIRDISGSKKLPIVVGGTGLYITSLIKPPQTIDIPPNADLRKRLAALPLTQVQSELRQKFPTLWSALNDSDKANSRRLVRRLEIGYAGNNQTKHKHAIAEDIVMIGLRAKNSLHYKQKIAERVEKRVKQGIIQEVAGLLSEKYVWDLPAMSSLGYREWKPYFEPLQQSRSASELNDLKTKILESWKKNEYEYAKRQMTWFGKEPSIQWFDIENISYPEAVALKVKQWLGQT